MFIFSKYGPFQFHKSGSVYTEVVLNIQPCNVRVIYYSVLTFYPLHITSTQQMWEIYGKKLVAGNWFAE